MSKALVNALAIALVEEFEGSLVLSRAKAFAEQFVAENADLLPRPEPSPSPDVAAFRGQVQQSRPVNVPANVPKCPNCHEPINDHMPNCARATGIDPRAVTPIHHLRADGPPPLDG